MVIEVIFKLEILRKHEGTMSIQNILTNFWKVETQME